MYIQITTRCNMHCAHCCFDCTSVGFEAACELANNYGSGIEIGGGEPTIHRQFWKFIGIALSYSEDCGIWLATNGSITKTALALARMTKAEVLICELSQDDYHDEIDESVVKAFSFGRFANIRNTSERSGEVIAAGRAIISDEKGLLNHSLRKDCPCSTLFITPDGKIWHCGCKTVQYGTVFNPKIPEEYWENSDECIIPFEENLQEEL